MIIIMIAMTTKMVMMIMMKANGLIRQQGL